MLVFVDTNIIIDYITFPSFKQFIDTTNDTYFYTETVKQEIEVQTDNYDLSKFNFINSKMKEKKPFY